MKSNGAEMSVFLTKIGGLNVGQMSISKVANQFPQQLKKNLKEKSEGGTKYYYRKKKKKKTPTQQNMERKTVHNLYNQKKNPTSRALIFLAAEQTKLLLFLRSTLISEIVCEYKSEMRGNRAREKDRR